MLGNESTVNRLRFLGVGSALAMLLTFFIPATAWADTTFLGSGERLDPCGELHSPNGRYTLQLKCYGELALVEDQWSTLWTSGTEAAGASTLEMQEDGNLVLYGEGHVANWESGTSGHPGAALGVQDDGNVVVIGDGNEPLWATNSHLWASTVVTVKPVDDSGGGYGPLGNREKELKSRLNGIYDAAARWQLDPRLLAAILHHEGGAYLDVRRSGVQAAEVGLVETRGEGTSVGIAQIQVRTARKMLQDQYQVTPPDVRTTAANLIFSDSFSIYVAASYLDWMRYRYEGGKFCGTVTSRELFIQYAFDARVACALRDYNYDIERITSDPNTPLTSTESELLKLRQGYYDSSWEQAGRVIKS